MISRRDDRSLKGAHVLAEGDEVLTPIGPGAVFAIDESVEGVALVRTRSGLKPLAFGDLTYPDGSPILTIKQQQRSAVHHTRLMEAQTPTGTELGDGFQLAELDLAAGHGWITDHTSTRVAFVRARSGEDGHRHWWLQRLDGAGPEQFSYPERLHSSQGHAALRAASWINWYMRDTGSGPGAPIPGHLATRKAKLTLARVRELRSLPLPVSPFTGATVSAPDWHDRWRRYTLTVEQMTVLAAAARAAYAATASGTAEARRRARVLTAAVAQLEFLAYDTARSHATIPSPGTYDPYAEPYTAMAAPVSITDLDAV